MIDETLQGDSSRLPAPVLQKAEDRVGGALRKNAALDADNMQALARKLEFCDLRELQDTIQNKALWPLFEPRFSNKERMIAKFDQLAELRNGIRHSRTVHDIARKEGEAAIIWFTQVLAK